MSLKKIGVVLLTIMLGIILSIFMNYFLLEKIIIPDPCYYHTHDTSFVFDFFYEITASEGFHPFPTKNNFMITILIGTGIGVFFLKKFNKG